MGGQELRAFLIAHLDVAQLRTFSKLSELLVRVEVASARDRLGRGGCPAQFGSGRVDGETTARP